MKQSQSKPQRREQHLESWLHPSFHSISLLAFVAKRWRSSNSHSSVAKKLSHITLSASPTVPIEGSTWAFLQRSPNSIKVYVVRAPIGVVHDALGGQSWPSAMVERREHTFRSQMLGHRPANGPAAESIQGHRQVKETGLGRDVGDLDRPRLIGTLGGNASGSRVVLVTHFRRHTPRSPSFASVGIGPRQPVANRLFPGVELLANSFTLQPDRAPSTIFWRNLPLRKFCFRHYSTLSFSKANAARRVPAFDRCTCALAFYLTPVRLL